MSSSICQHIVFDAWVVLSCSQEEPRALCAPDKTSHPLPRHHWQERGGDPALWMPWENTHPFLLDPPTNAPSSPLLSALGLLEIILFSPLSLFTSATLSNPGRPGCPPCPPLISKGLSGQQSKPLPQPHWHCPILCFVFFIPLSPSAYMYVCVCVCICEDIRVYTMHMCVSVLEH